MPRGVPVRQPVAAGVSVPEDPGQEAQDGEGPHASVGEAPNAALVEHQGQKEEADVGRAGLGQNRERRGEEGRPVPPRSLAPDPAHEGVGGQDVAQPHETIRLHGRPQTYREGAQREEPGGHEGSRWRQEHAHEGERREQGTKGEAEGKESSDKWMLADELVAGGHGPGEDGELRLDEPRAIAAPVDARLQDVHALAVKVPGDARDIAFAPGIDDGAIEGDAELGASQEGTDQEKRRHSTGGWGHGSSWRAGVPYSYWRTREDSARILPAKCPWRRPSGTS